MVFGMGEPAGMPLGPPLEVNGTVYAADVAREWLGSGWVGCFCFFFGGGRWLEGGGAGEHFFFWLVGVCLLLMSK